MSAAEPISAEFPFESRFVEVESSKIHYVEQGEGQPILFLHGNPTSAYLWRNIIPYAAGVGRAIAIDLIGMGQSDKPDLDYRFVDHVRYLEGAIEALGLEDVVLVVHDWGSALGFHYASRNEANVRGLAFMEAFMRTVPGWEQFPEQGRDIFQNFRTPEVGWDLIAKQNLFVEAVLPGSIVRELTEEEMDAYRRPYPDERSRKPVWKWPNEIPIAGEPADVSALVTTYSLWLQETDLPKILFAAEPGALTPPVAVEWARASLKNLEVVEIGPGVHFVQEDNPHEIGRELARWIKTI